MSGLLDFLQSASNTAASTVSGPVDLIGMLLRKAGVPVPQDSLGSSEWMKQKGLMQDVPQSAASLAGETFGLLSPVVAAAKAPQIAGGLLKMGENAAAPRTLNPQAGALDIDAIGAAIGQHKQRLLDEANDWASRAYKRNDKVIHFAGDGPGPEGMRISAINEGRRNANVENRMAQVRALNTLTDNIAANPAKVEAIYNQAAANARNDISRVGGLTYDQLLDVYIGQSMAGMKDWAHGPNSIGGALRMAIESGIKPTQAKPTQVAPVADDWMKELFGG